MIRVKNRNNLKFIPNTYLWRTPGHPLRYLPPALSSPDNRVDPPRLALSHVAGENHLFSLLSLVPSRTRRTTHRVRDSSRKMSLRSQDWRSRASAWLGPLRRSSSTSHWSNLWKSAGWLETRTLELLTTVSDHPVWIHGVKSAHFNNLEQNLRRLKASFKKSSFSCIFKGCLKHRSTTSRILTSSLIQNRMGKQMSRSLNSSHSCRLCLNDRKR